jgi:dCMP deaminase
MHPRDMQFCIRVVGNLTMMSRATRARVGCVIWHRSSRRIISVGYNGTACGHDNTMEVDGRTLDTVIHAEVNALQKLTWWERWLLLPDSVLFVSHTPCVKCSQHILTTRIPQVYYLENYGNTHMSMQLFQDSHCRLTRLLER